MVRTLFYVCIIIDESNFLTHNLIKPYCRRIRSSYIPHCSNRKSRYPWDPTYAPVRVRPLKEVAINRAAEVSLERAIIFLLDYFLWCAAQAKIVDLLLG